jgi:hypothetical protein
LKGVLTHEYNVKWSLRGLERLQRLKAIFSGVKVVISLPYKGAEKLGYQMSGSILIVAVMPTETPWMLSTYP